MSDAQHYRTKDEVAEYKKIDPITKVKELLLKKKYASQKQIDEIDSRAQIYHEVPYHLCTLCYLQ